ncbi:hypothetical protein GCM10022226_01960 [Sphaerisporangium flaviroseum]|uniref:histidine kinase n=1 Tax=Sphaerisporangium flaviroseum TaxID=509199 RepID=A0ABP7H7B0_9ACTN
MVTEHTPPDGRPRSSIAAAGAALSRLGRLRDLPVILMLAWVGWLAIPWPFSGLAQTRSTTDQPLTTGVPAGLALETDPSAGPIPAGWTVNAVPAHAGLVVHTVAPAGPHGPPSAYESPGVQEPPSAQELIDAERARIAGEVHDAAGHGLATIAMQAGVALLMLDERPDQVRESLEAIRSTSMQALDQLRSALDLIDPKASDHDLARLVDGVRAAGLPVVVEPAEPDLPAHLRDTVYRVVRESLTNVLRHAGPAGAVVRVTRGPYELVLEITDRGSGPSAAAEGRGLAGMRARVVAAGGTFSAGPHESGGFRVAARFPLRTT